MLLIRRWLTLTTEYFIMMVIIIGRGKWCRGIACWYLPWTKGTVRWRHERFIRSSISTTVCSAALGHHHIVKTVADKVDAIRLDELFEASVRDDTREWQLWSGDVRLVDLVIRPWSWGDNNIRCHNWRGSWEGREALTWHLLLLLRTTSLLGL